MRRPTRPTRHAAGRTGPRTSFSRWLRSTSEEQLLLAAQRKLALRYGAPEPPKPHGIDVLWQRVYAPTFYAVPYPVRAKIANRLPGSHRRTWHQPPQGRGPAV